MQHHHIFLLFCLPLAFGCHPHPDVQPRPLTASEQHLLDSFQIDTSIATEIRKYNSSDIEPFHYSLSTKFADGKETEVDPILLKGILFKNSYLNSDKLVAQLSDSFSMKGYTIFVVERRFGLHGKPDDIAVLKTTDKYEVLKDIKTDGTNFGISNDSLLPLIRRFDNEYALQLVGASGDWCEFIIHKDPTNWLDFAKEVYKVCPDVVDQGTETVQALADEMKKSRRLYFWWD